MLETPVDPHIACKGRRQIQHHFCQVYLSTDAIHSIPKQFQNAGQVFVYHQQDWSTHPALELRDAPQSDARRN